MMARSDWRKVNQYCNRWRCGVFGGMVTPLPILSITTPCTVPWNVMHGDDRVRYCGQCRRQVFDLTNLTSAEVADLLGDGGSLPCVAFYSRADGRVVTADCSLSIRERTWKWLRRRAAWAAAVFASLFLPACRTQTMGMLTCDYPAAATSALPKSLESPVAESKSAADAQPRHEKTGGEPVKGQ